jgi:hypothetical protein
MFAIFLWMFAGASRKERVHERSIYDGRESQRLLMAKMPNIVRSRLALRTPASSHTHPDANLLAAFAEQTLLARERADVTAHLAACVDCREYLALAFAIEPSAMAATRSITQPSRGWFGQWRWAAATAVCCVLAIALQYQAQPPMVLVARRDVRATVPPAAVDAIASKQKTREPIPPPTRKVQVEHPGSQRVPAELAANKQTARESMPPQITGPASATPPDAVLAIRRLHPAPADSASSFLAPERETAPQAEAAGSALRASNAATAPSEPGLKSAQAGRALGFPAQAFTRMATPAPKAIVKTAIAPEAPSVLWSINASPDAAGASRGVVQRSTDAGQTWEVVPLTARVSFRAASSAGPDVWAGGSDAALFHSSDGGAHWVEMAITQEGAIATGAIVRIDLRGPSEITIRTSSGEDWTTSDAGRHWKRL